MCPARTRTSRARVSLAAVAFGFVAMAAVPALATDIKPGQAYQGEIVACGTQQEAETLRGFVIAGKLDKAKDYLRATDNTCGVGAVRFIPEQEIGAAKNDQKGHAWKIVKIALPTTEAYLVTTAELVVGLAT